MFLKVEKENFIMKKQLIALGASLVLTLGAALPSMAACPCQFMYSPCPAAAAPCCPSLAVKPCCPKPVITPCCPAIRPCCPAKPCCKEVMPCPCPAAPVEPCCDKTPTCDDCCD